MLPGGHREALRWVVFVSLTQGKPEKKTFGFAHRTTKLQTTHSPSSIHLVS